MTMKDMQKIPSTGIRLYSSEYALSIDGPSGILTPEIGREWRWRWTTWDGGIDAFADDAEALSRLCRDYPDAIVEVRS